MTFMRGDPADYDAWARVAGEAWAWRAVLPYFRRIEDRPGDDDHDHDGTHREGMGYTQATVRHGRRMTAASACLAPARSRANFAARARCTVRRILFAGTRTAG